MTPRGRWMALPGLVGLFLGVLRGQAELSLLSMAVLIWLAVEWAMFSWRVWVELPQLQIERTVNGRAEPTGLLWAGRVVTITVRVTLPSRRRSDGTTVVPSLRRRDGLLSIGPLVLFRDVVPENIEVLERVTRLKNVPLLRSPRRSSEDHQPVANEHCFSEDSEAVAHPEPLAANEFLVRERSTTVTFTYTARVRSAGQVVLPGLRLTLKDAQGFFLAERFVALPQTFRVLPAYAEAGDVHPLVKRTNSLPQHGIHRLQRSGLGSELLELREYVPGDPPKAIAWKVSARRDKLMTRQYESEVPVRVQLFLDGSISTRLGGFGSRLLDQMTYVAASVARASISVGDPVGAMLFDERGAKRLPPQGGERGFYRLLDALADFSINPAPPAQSLTPPMIAAAMSLAGERYPELLDGRVNQVPFTIFPILPWNRRRFRERFLLSGVLAEVFQLTALEQVRMMHEPSFMAGQVQRFLTQAGVAWMEPLVAGHEWWNADHLRTATLAEALVKGVTHARDNEVFVILADLLDSAAEISGLLPAVKMALGRHHRVAFVCPSPTFRRPTISSTEPATDTVDDLVAAAEQLKARDLATGLQRELRRLGAAVTCSGEKAAIHMVLSEMEIARTGRMSPTGVRR
ncbi:MAG: DUF58 domain-containing protein [Planctomycetota bacterium]|nr:MAG: DUF58 domain-containing protein [Planctomycetota bacterium]